MTESMLAVAGRLGSSADALAALGALIRIESEQLPVDPDVQAVLQAAGRAGARGHVRVLRCMAQRTWAAPVQLFLGRRP